MQKLAVRYITCSKYNAHTEPLFIQLKLLMVQDIYKLNVLKFFYKYQNDTLPNFFNEMFDPVYPKHEHFTRQREKPVVVRGNSVAANRSIRFSLPQTILDTQKSIIEKVKTHSFQGFVNYAKNCFIGLYNPTCLIRNCWICRRESS